MLRVGVRLPGRGAVPCGAQLLVHVPIGGALGLTDDPDGLELRTLDVDPDLGERHDSVHERLTTGDTRWTLDPTDPYAWLDPAAAERDGW